jgi:hypothetical protein
MSISNSPSPGFLTLTSSIFQPPFARVSRQTMALPLLEDMLLLDVCWYRAFDGLDRSYWISSLLNKTRQK